MKTLLSTLAVIVGATSFSTQAEPVKVDMKAGLWENKIMLDKNSTSDAQAQQAEQIKTAMEQMKAQFANMPPEQRKQIEAMMGQSGMKVGEDGVSFNNNQVEISAEGTTAKTCITQAQIDRGELPDDIAGCKSTLTQISDRKFKSAHACENEQSVSGESEITFQSPTQYTGNGFMQQKVEGKMQKTAFTMAGKWLGSDCGSIKPN